MSGDPLATVSVRYFDHARSEAIELTCANGGSERIEGTAGDAAELARKAELKAVPTTDGTRLWVKDLDAWED